MKNTIADTFQPSSDVLHWGYLLSNISRCHVQYSQNDTATVLYEQNARLTTSVLHWFFHSISRFLDLCPSLLSDGPCWIIGREKRRRSSGIGWEPMTSSHSIRQAKVSNRVDICFILYVAVTRPRVWNSNSPCYSRFLLQSRLSVDFGLHPTLTPTRILSVERWHEIFYLEQEK